MPGPVNLANAALRQPTRRWGSTCHHAVFEWLEAAGFIGENELRSLLLAATPATGGVPGVASRILVTPQDRRLTRRELANVIPGQLIGFYTGTQYWHSMVTVTTFWRGAALAGVNNLNVGGRYLYERIRLGNIPWNADDTVGPNHYVVRTAGVDRVEQRVQSALGVSLVQSHLADIRAAARRMGLS